MNTDLLTERLEKIGWQLSANQLEGILEDASKNNVAYSDFLNSILMTEIEHRESTELSKRIKRARLPYFKTLEDFDFAFQPSINEKRVREVMTCRFIDNGFNVLLLGQPGVGKTHLAISIAAEAVTKGYLHYRERFCRGVSKSREIWSSSSYNQKVLSIRATHSR